jgi:excisionase family DNA binding protein
LGLLEALARGSHLWEWIVTKQATLNSVSLQRVNTSERTVVHPEPLFITRKETARLLGYSVQFVDQMIDNNLIEVIRPGRSVRIDRHSVQKWIDAEREKQREKLHLRDQAEKAKKNRSAVSR